MAFAVAEQDPAGDLPMATFGQHDVRVSVTVQVADAGVGGRFRNRFERNDVERAPFAVVWRGWPRGRLCRRYRTYDERTAADQTEADDRRSYNSKTEPRTELDHVSRYLASGSGLIWNFTSLLVSPFPPSEWNGARVAYVVKMPLPFHPPFGLSIRPSMPLA